MQRHGPARRSKGNDALTRKTTTDKPCIHAGVNSSKVFNAFFIV